jgi:hypothetical protein
MVSTDHFRRGLLAQMARAAKGGQIDVLINCGQLYRSLGGYPGSTPGMPLCCDAMQSEMKPGDTMILDRANGAGMTVRYLLPRSKWTGHSDELPTDTVVLKQRDRNG